MKVLTRFTYSGLAGPVEYDVPKCSDGTPSELCVHEIQGQFQGKSRDCSVVFYNFHAYQNEI